MHKIKKIWLMGGFGNVLFQVLAFNVLSKKNKNIFFIKILTQKNIITKFFGWTIHQELYSELIDNKQFKKVHTFKVFIILLVSLYSKKFKRKVKIATFYDHDNQIDNDISENIFGYFQDKYFLKQNQKDLLDLGGTVGAKYRLEKSFPIVVHYRKGDSAWATKFSYYYDEIKRLLQNESLPILIVSDSFDDAKFFFKDVKNIKILSSNNAIDDFKYLVSADKLYCAPSTFSWWASHSLNNKAELIMPKFLDEYLGIYVNRKYLTII